MILDLHIHSKYSFDSILEPRRILKMAKKKGLNGIAITDHDTIKGGVEVRSINKNQDFIVIVGVEICTEMGDIIGLFLNEEINPRESIGVVEEIHNQGGIAILPHPYKGHRLDDDVIKKIDVIEGYNSRTSEDDDRKALSLAERHKKPVIAGSDAHFLSEIGTSRVVLDSTDVRGEILQGKSGIETTKTPLYKVQLSQIIKSIKLAKYGEIPGQLKYLLKYLKQSSKDRG